MNDRTTRLFCAGDILPEESDCLWLITSGAVKSYTIDRQNRTIILGFWGVEDVVGKPLSRIEPYFLQCMNEVRAVAIAPDGWSNLSGNLLNRIEQIQELSYIVRNPKVGDRLWLLLKWLANKFGRQTPEGKLIELKISIQELGQLLDLSETTINEILLQFQREGAILEMPGENILLKK